MRCTAFQLTDLIFLKYLLILTIYSNTLYYKKVI